MDELSKKSTQQKYEIVRLIRAKGSISRLAISESFDIALPTVSALVKDLEDAGIVASQGFKKSTGGRPPEMLTIAGDYGVVIGAEVSYGRIASGLVDTRGEVVTERGGGETVALDAGAALSALEESVNSVLSSLGSRKLLGAGIGVSGIIADGNRVSRQFPGSKEWSGVPLADWFEQRFGVRPTLMNDVSAAALGEARCGAWGSETDMLYLHVGRGIAAGVVLKGKVYRGATGNAGEVGHFVVRSDGPICYCGNRGCLESVASPDAIVAQCREAIHRGSLSLVAHRMGTDLNALSIEDLFGAARQGDRLSSTLLEEAGGHIGRTAAQIVNLLNPSVLVLGGILAGERSTFVESIERAFRSTVLPALRDVTRVGVSHLKERACVAGAAQEVLDEFFSSPDRLFGSQSVGHP